MDLSQVSRTAILTLIARVVDSSHQTPILHDPLGDFCLQRLIAISTDEEKRQIEKWQKMYSGINARVARTTSLRALAFDQITDRYVSTHPGCTVINLACGFDTRFWRIKNLNCRFIELDLPEMIAIKKELLKEHLSYDLISASVLDPAWIDQVTAQGNSNFLLLAEGLFMYLPGQEASRLLQEISRRFVASQFALDLALQKYTRGLWKWFLKLEARAWGLNVSTEFGINQPLDIESFSDGFKLLDTGRGTMGPLLTVSINAA